MVTSSEVLIEIPEVGKHITGEPLRGTVKFNLDQNAVYKSVTLTLVEKVCSPYTFDHKNIADYCTIPIHAGDLNHYQTRKVVKVNLLKHITGADIVLTSGSYEHSFEMKIPEKTPPSVRTTHKGKTLGGIRYFLILKFKNPELFNVSDYFITKLTIHARIDSTSTEKPLIASLEKIVTKLFSSKKNGIAAKVELDKEYIIPSSERKIIFIVNNNSDLVFTIKSELICKTSTHVRIGKTVEQTDVLATVETPSIPDNSVSNMFNIIPVRQEVFTVRHSKAISREYIIRVTMKLPTPHSNAYVEIPVFAGIRI